MVREKMKALSVYGKISWLQCIGIAGTSNIVMTCSNAGYYVNHISLIHTATDFIKEFKQFCVLWLPSLIVMFNGFLWNI